MKISCKAFSCFVVRYIKKMQLQPLFRFYVNETVQRWHCELAEHSGALVKVLPPFCAWQQ